MKDYGLFLESLKERINEMAIYNLKLKKIRNMYNIGNFKKSLKEIEILKENLIEDLKNIKLSDIKLDITEYKNCDKIQIDYKQKYTNQMLGLIELVEDLEDSNIKYRIFPEGEMNFNINIDIDKKNFNSIDILESLPYFVKNIGLGKKIIKKIIEKYNYVSLHSHKDPSNEIKMLFHSLIKDHNYYSFIDEFDSILVLNKLDKDSIFKKIEKFLKYSKTYQIDDDFLKDFN